MTALVQMFNIGAYSEKIGKRYGSKWSWGSVVDFSLTKTKKGSESTAFFCFAKPIKY